MSKIVDFSGILTDNLERVIPRIKARIFWTALVGALISFGIVFSSDLLNTYIDDEASISKEDAWAVLAVLIFCVLTAIIIVELFAFVARKIKGGSAPTSRLDHGPEPDAPVLRLDRAGAAPGRQIPDHVILHGEAADLDSRGGNHVPAGTTGAVRRTVEEVVNTIDTYLDMSVSKVAESSARALTFNDELTGLLSPTLFRDRVEHALARARRDGSPVAILFVSLEDFKHINDRLGREPGDILLQNVASRLMACVRRADTVARHGGPEFTVLLQGHGSQRNIEATIERINGALSRPIALAGHPEVTIAATIGVCRFPHDGNDCGTLINNARVAMHRAKERGRNKFAYFDPELNRRGNERIILQRELRQALDDGAFVLHFQPEVDCATGRVTALEALIRWQHPGGALLRPAQFIDAAEDGGLIEPLGEWVLAEACRQGRAWQGCGSAPVPIAVNIAARQLLRQDVPGLVGRALAESGLEPALLELELTENAVMRDPERIRRTLASLKDLGVRIALDDFGTGSFPLRHLCDLPLDLLKIDNSFVHELGDVDGNGAIVAAVVAIGRELKLTVVAEGVEHARQARFLSHRGCDRLQGYLFARPTPAAMIETLLGADKQFDMGGELAEPLGGSA